MELDLVNSCLKFNDRDVPYILDSRNEPWFKGNDVASCLGYENPSQAICKNLKDAWKRPRGSFQNGNTLTHNEKKEMYINEPGIYKLVGRCKLSAADAFETWLYEEVLPSIRKTGGYSIPSAGTPTPPLDWFQTRLDSIEQGKAKSKSLDEIIRRVAKNNQEMCVAHAKINNIVNQTVGNFQCTTAAFKKQRGIPASISFPQLLDPLKQSYKNNLELYIIEMVQTKWATLEKVTTIDQLIYWVTSVCSKWGPIFQSISDHMIALPEAKQKQKELTKKRKSGMLLPTINVSGTGNTINVTAAAVQPSRSENPPQHGHKQQEEMSTAWQLLSSTGESHYLVQNPQITFFRQITRRFSNFALESVNLTVYGNTDFESKITVPISRTGDLLLNLQVEVTFPDLTKFDFVTSDPTAPQPTDVRWVDYLAHACIVRAELDGQGHKLDELDKHSLHAWHQLTIPYEKETGVNELIMADGQGATDTYAHPGGRTVYLHLPFHFSRSPGNALPMCALPHQEIRLNLEFEPALALLKSDTAAITRIVPKDGVTEFKMGKVLVYADYAFLSTVERNRFMTSSGLEYVTENWQQGLSPVTYRDLSTKVNVPFVHPVKCLFWMYVDQRDMERNTLTGNNYFKYSVQEFRDADVINQANILFLGHERMSARPGVYFRNIQPMLHFPRIPLKNIYMYSFALHPSDGQQPQGAANLSKIDTVTLNLNFNEGLQNGKLLFYGLSHNVIRIKDGLIQLAFSQ